MSAALDRGAPGAAHAAQVLAELHHADHIINVMLNAMTLQQKERVHQQLDAAGVCGEGMARADERRAVLEDAQAGAQVASASSAPGRARLADIEAQEHDISAQGRDIAILLQAVFDQLDSTKQAPPPAAAVINCFATCALRNAMLMREAAENILALASEGGAA